MTVRRRESPKVAFLAILFVAAAFGSHPARAAEIGPESSETRVQAVAPGVERILDDGAGHRFDRGRVRDVAIDAAGNVWLGVDTRIVELGRSGTYEPRSDRWRRYLRELVVTPEGQVWAGEDGGAVLSLADGSFEDRSGSWLTVGSSLSTSPDGRLWRVAQERGQAPTVVSSEDGRTWEPAPTSGVEPLLFPGSARYTIVQTADGRVWLGADHGDRGGGLAVLEDDVWTILSQKTPRGAVRVRDMAAAADDGIWVLAEVGPPGPRTRHVLIRYRSNEAETLDASTGMPQRRTRVWTDWSPFEPAALAVDQAGRVWFALDGVGLWTYGGSGFEQIGLPGLRSGALDLEIAPDGSVWVASRQGGLFRIAEDYATS